MINILSKLIKVLSIYIKIKRQVKKAIILSNEYFSAIHSSQTPVLQIRLFARPANFFYLFFAPFNGGVIFFPGKAIGIYLHLLSIIYLYLQSLTYKYFYVLSHCVYN